MKTLFSANIVSELEIRERMTRFYHKSSSEAREETKTTDMRQIFFHNSFHLPQSPQARYVLCHFLTILLRTVSNEQLMLFKVFAGPTSNVKPLMSNTIQNSWALV